MATGITTPLRLEVRDQKGYPGRLTIRLIAGQVGGRSRTTCWEWSTEAATWWHFGSLLVDEAICMAVEGVVPNEWPRRLDQVLAEVMGKAAAELAHPPIMQ